MAPPIDPEKMKAALKNPWASGMIGKDLELLKLKKKQNEERECVTDLRARPRLTNLVAGGTRKPEACCRRSWACCCASWICASALVGQPVYRLSPKS